MGEYSAAGYAARCWHTYYAGAHQRCTNCIASSVTLPTYIVSCRQLYEKSNSHGGLPQGREQSPSFRAE